MATTTTNTVFNGSTNVIGVYNAFSTTVSQVYISSTEFKNNTTEAKDSLLNNGFLVRQYNLQFGQATSMERVLNKSGAIYHKGMAQGTLDLQGLTGSADAFVKLFGNGGALNEKNNNNPCGMFHIRIVAGGDLAACDENDKSMKGGAVVLECVNCMLTTFTANGQVSGNGEVISGAGLRFSVTGLKISNSNTENPLTEDDYN